jgi:carbon storage regulator CsrA
MALVLIRREGECVQVNGPCTVKVLRVEGRRVQLVFDAPPETSIVRVPTTAEIRQQIKDRF